MVTESRYYRNVAVWLEKKGYYVGRSAPNLYRINELFIRKGRKKLQVDVAGVKNVGKGLFDEIEIVIIEVKHSNYARPIGLKELDQTKSYQVYAHNCYLAITEKIEISPETQRDADNRGIGLLRIPFDFYRKKPNQVRADDIEIICTPHNTIPNEAEMLEFLDTLGILRCVICGCYFNSRGEYEEEFPQLSPKNASFKRLERNKVFDLFPDRIDDQFNIRHKHSKSKTWRQVCLLCIEDLARLFGIEKLKKEIDVLKNEISKFK